MNVLQEPRTAKGGPLDEKFMQELSARVVAMATRTHARASHTRIHLVQ